MHPVLMSLTVIVAKQSSRLSEIASAVQQLRTCRLFGVHTVTQSNKTVNAMLGQASSFHQPARVQIHRLLKGNK